MKCRCQVTVSVVVVAVALYKAVPFGGKGTDEWVDFVQEKINARGQDHS